MYPLQFFRFLNTPLPCQTYWPGHIRVFFLVRPSVHACIHGAAEVGRGALGPCNHFSKLKVPILPLPTFCLCEVGLLFM